MITLLLIENEPILLTELQDTLAIEGFEVIGTDNGNDGIRLAQEHLPDVIVCDVMMPAPNGYAVLDALKQDPKTASIPFIFLTALVSKTERQKALEAGVDTFLEKPFSLEVLLDVIRRHVDGQ